MKRALGLVLFLSIAGNAFAAEKAAPKPTAKQATEEKQTYLNKADKEVQDLTTKIQTLEDQSKTSGAKVRQELDRHLQAIHEGLDAARKKLDALRGSSANAWDSLREGLDRTLADVKRHYQKAVSSTSTPVKK